MIAVTISLSGAVLVALANLCMRQNINLGGSNRIYLSIQFLVSFAVSLTLHPLASGNYVPSAASVVVGTFAGAMLSLMLWALGQSMKLGRSGLAIALVNAASVIPAVILAPLIGNSDFLAYTKWHAIGSIAVVAGLVWAGLKRDEHIEHKKWFYYSSISFISSVLLIFLLQGWSYIINYENFSAHVSWKPYLLTDGGDWFLPVFFGSALICQLVWLCAKSRPPLKKTDITFGMIAGILNEIACYLLILAPQLARPGMKPVIFPLRSVGIMIFCALWARILYRERTNWIAYGLCVCGLALGALD